MDFTKGIICPGNELPTQPTVEFTEDEWNTVHKGVCVDKTFYSYLVRGQNYGTFWIPKEHVRLSNDTKIHKKYNNC